MNIKNLLVAAISIALFSASFAQEPDTTKHPKTVLRKVILVRSAPDFTLQFNLNYNQAMGQLAGTYNDDFQSAQFINGRSLGTDKGFGANLFAKLTSPNRHVRFTLSASYNRMLTYLLSGKEIADQGESKFNFFSFGLGLENSFTPNHLVKIYAGGEGVFSIINGNATLWVENRGGTPYTYNIKIKNSYRIGASIFGGAEYMMSNSYGFNFGFKITHANLLLKDSKPSGNPNEINLIDQEVDPNNPAPYGGRKQIVFLSVVAGVSLYWGIEEKRYILPK